MFSAAVPSAGALAVPLHCGRAPVRVYARAGQRIGVGGEEKRAVLSKCRAASVPSPSPFAWDDAQNGAATPKLAQNGAGRKVEVFAKSKWKKGQDSFLSDSREPLPLPMTWPDAEPASPEKIDQMLSCDPEEQTCKDVIYQWTGECKRCQGTGLTSFSRGRRQVVSKCANCLGIGYVHKITSRADIQAMDGIDGGSGSSENGGARRYEKE